MRGNCDTCVYFHSTEYFCQLDDSETNEVNSCPQYETKKVKPLSEILPPQKLEEIIINYTHELTQLREYYDECLIQHKDKINQLKKELKQVKGAYDDRCEDIEGYLQTFLDIRKVLYSCSKIEDKIKEIEEIIIFGYDNNEESENRTLEDWLR